MVYLDKIAFLIGFIFILYIIYLLITNAFKKEPPVKINIIIEEVNSSRMLHSKKYLDDLYLLGFRLSSDVKGTIIFKKSVTPEEFDNLIKTVTEYLHSLGYNTIQSKLSNYDIDTYVLLTNLNTWEI